MIKYTILISIFISSCFSDNILSLKCGLNKNTKTTDDLWYAFDEEIIEGEITFIGRVYDMRNDVNINIYRGLGVVSNYNQNRSLYIYTSQGGHSTKLGANTLTNGYDREFFLDENVLKENAKNEAKITIMKDRYELYFNGKHRWTWSRMVDEGMMIKAASITGNFMPQKIILNCGKQINSNEEDDD